MIELSIIIPTYNEAKRISQTLDALAAYLAENGILNVTEVLVVDSASTDETQAIVAAKQELFPISRLLAQPQRHGKGFAVREGMLTARGTYRIFMDADLATPLSYIGQALDAAKKGSDVVIGVRDTQKIHKGLIRKLISFFGNAVTQVVLLPGIPDTQCGFKLFSAKAAAAIFPKQRIIGWGFDMEILALARKYRFKLVMLPVPDWRDVPAGPFSRENPLKAALSSLKELFVIRFNLWLGRYR